MTHRYTPALAWTVLALAGLGGCPSDGADPADDSGVQAPMDAGHDSGAQALDSGLPDGGFVEPDAGETDAGTTETDAGTMEMDASVALPVTPAAAGDVVITEIQAAPAGYADDSLAEWVEIHNPSTTITYDLNGCVFSDKPADSDYTFAAELLIPPGGYVVVSSVAFTELTHGFVSDAVYGATGTGLSGTADAPTLRCGAVVIDTVSYSLASGFPVPDDMEGHTLALDPGAADAAANDLGTNWCVGSEAFFTSATLVNYGTPRAANTACP